MPTEGIIGSERISSVGDLVASQKNFYYNYHYRILNHTLLQLLLLLPAWIFDALNVLVFLVLPACLLRIRPALPQYGRHYMFLLFFIWVFHFDLGRCYFLTTGSLNYSWLLIPQLLYLTELYRQWQGSGSGRLLLLLALLNANSNENAQVVLFLMTLYVGWQQRKALMIWASAAVLLAGGLFMLASPSISSRLAEQGLSLIHISEPTRPERISYAVFCLKKK